MTYTLLAIAVGCAALDWLAVGKGWRPLEYVTKPLVMILLLAWLWQASGMRGWMLWFAAGIAFSLAGDIFLMLPRDRFLSGLSAFLVAHIAYIAGFSRSFPPVTAGTMAAAVILAIIVWRVYARISTALAEHGESALAFPVLAYSLVLTMMALSAIVTLFRPEWARLHALIAGSGALLFFASDGMLAWNRFVAPLPHARLHIMYTYHLGQISIVLGAALHFVR
jgi:uncharacterized membrane protein YhhN